LTRVRLTISSNLGDVVYVGLFVNKICEHLRMGAESAYQVELCAVEAATNAIRHAYANDPNKEVSVTLAVHSDRLELEVVDTGTAMSPDQEQRLMKGSKVFDFDPTDQTSLPEGGMGLQIIHDVMDEVSYKRDAGANSLQLIRLFRAVEDRCSRNAPSSRPAVQVSSRRKACVERNNL
jgi:serine/threonine-protein kinase RsbW